MKTAGITFKRNTCGVPALVGIDLKRHGDKLKDFFASGQVELDESPYYPEFVAKIRRSEEQIAVGKFKVVKTDDFMEIK
ncbi:MAG: hypothetical protein LBP98_01815 [Tannerella sp.]|jgi:hypothetical protein|nr:hypothetical protein [Tannerella sp.]